MTKNHDRAHGFLDEQVQEIDPERRRGPGRIVGSRRIVDVEFNDYDGYGPYVVTMDLHDLERPFPAVCKEQIEYLDGARQSCEGRRDQWGNCPRERYHVKEEK